MVEKRRTSQQSKSSGIRKERTAAKKVSILNSPSGEISETLKMSGSKISISRSSTTDVPLTGSALLNWMKNRMSYAQPLENDSSEELIKTTDMRRGKKHLVSTTNLRGSRVSSKIGKFMESTENEPKDLIKGASKEKIKESNKTLKIKGKNKEKQSQNEEEIEKTLTHKKQTEDEVMYQWRMRTYVAEKQKEKLRLERERMEKESIAEYEKDKKETDEEDKKGILVKGSKQIIKTKRKKKEQKKEKIKQEYRNPREDEATQKEQERERLRKREEARRRGVLRLQQEKEDHENRIFKNSRTLKWISELENMIKRDNKNILDELEWIHYKECDKAPFPISIGQITAFIKDWERKSDEMTMDQLIHVINTNMKLIDQLNNLKHNPLPDDMVKQLEKLKGTSRTLRDIQKKMIDKSIYDILKNYNKNLRINIELDYGEYSYVSDPFALCIWLKVQLPVSQPNPRKPPDPSITISFPEIEMDLICPTSLQFENMTLICFRPYYDHLSFDSRDFRAPPTPKWATEDINQTTMREMLMKMKYAHDNKLRSVYLHKGDQLKRFVLPDLPPDKEIPELPWIDFEPNYEQYADVADDLEYEQSLRDLLLTTEQGEVNLRVFDINGGFFNLNLVYHPPQPQPMVTLQLNTRRVTPPRVLETVSFFAEYQPPERPPSLTTINTSQGTIKPKSSSSSAFDEKSISMALQAKRLEEEMMQKHREEILEWEEALVLAMDKLILVNLRLPNTCIYLEIPTICVWDDVKKFWTTNDIYDVKFDTSENKVSFRISKFGIYGIASNKFANYPYDSWEIKPKTDHSISVTLVGSKVSIHLSISERDLFLEGIEYNLPFRLMGPCLNDLIGQKYSVHGLFKALKRRGLNLFPDFDANCYYKETTEKHWPMSLLTYYAIAQSSIAFNFSSSKWNRQVNRRSIVLQVREYDQNDPFNTLKPYILVRVNPLRSEPIEGSEADDEFSDTPLQAPKHQPNLSYLLKTMCGAVGRNRIASFSEKTYTTLAQFLLKTRILSFS